MSILDIEKHLHKVRLLELIGYIENQESAKVRDSMKLITFETLKETFENGNTILHYVVSSNQEINELFGKKIETLLDNGVSEEDIKELALIKNNDQLTPIDRELEAKFAVPHEGPFVLEVKNMEIATIYEQMTFEQLFNYLDIFADTETIRSIKDIQQTALSIAAVHTPLDIEVFQMVSERSNPYYKEEIPHCINRGVTSVDNLYVPCSNPMFIGVRSYDQIKIVVELELYKEDIADARDILLELIEAGAITMSYEELTDVYSKAFCSTPEVVDAYQIWCKEYMPTEVEHIYVGEPIVMQIGGNIFGEEELGDYYR